MLVKSPMPIDRSRAGAEGGRRALFVVPDRRVLPALRVIRLFRSGADAGELPPEAFTPPQHVVSAMRASIRRKKAVPRTGQALLCRDRHGVRHAPQDAGQQSSQSFGISKEKAASVLQNAA
jgi:hypothetical protein